MTAAALSGGAQESRVKPAWNETASLTEILDEIRASLSADTATVLVIDRTRSRLETRARVGLEPVVSMLPRIPLGQGFAGRVAQSRQPLILRTVTADSVADPSLLRHSVSRLLGAPIIVGGELLGVLHVGRKPKTDFKADDVVLLSDLANSLGHVLRARFISESHIAALTLQRSLLPDQISPPAGLQISARYIPASGDLGGDWYDVFNLPSGPLVLVMGDVVGHGLEAAVIMGRLRSALRSYALESADPAEVIRRLDRKICYFEPGALATVIMAVAEPPYDRWRISSAGHLPPLVKDPERGTAPADITVDRLVGIDPDSPRRSVEVFVQSGGSLCLFTDGLVERRPTQDADACDILDRKIAELAAALDRSTTPEVACISILSDVVGEDRPDDDLALLIAQRTED